MFEVVSVDQDSPLLGRVLPGDRIVSLNGQPVFDPRALTEAVSQAPPGIPLRLGLIRPSMEHSVEFDLPASGTLGLVVQPSSSGPNALASGQAARFCSNCGAPAAGAYCSACGSPIGAGITPGSGRALGGPAGPTQPASPRPQRPVAPKMPSLPELASWPPWVYVLSPLPLIAMNLAILYGEQTTQQSTFDLYLPVNIGYIAFYVCFGAWDAYRTRAATSGSRFLFGQAITFPWIYLFIRQHRARQDISPAVAYLITTGIWLVLVLAIYQQMPSAVTGRVTCEELAKNVIRVSEESSRGAWEPFLLSVTNTSVETNNQAKPPSGSRRTLLVCTGTGLFDDGQKVPIRMELWADSNGDAFVEYSAK